MLRTRHQKTTKLLFANAKVPMGCQKSSDASSDANSDVGSDSGFDAGVAAASLRVSAEAADLRMTPASKFHGRFPHWFPPNDSDLRRPPARELHVRIDAIGATRRCFPEARPPSGDTAKCQHPCIYRCTA